MSSKLYRPSGILLIDKPEMVTSAHVDRICRKLINADKVGHIGTLDSFATGLLVLAINDGTKAIRYINSPSKTYEFEIKFGEKTTTGDITGDITEKCHKSPSLVEVNNILPRFTGKLIQTPHAFSAIKINGQRAYKIARNGKIPELQPREISVFSLKLLKKIDDMTYRLEATVSPGTYIRSLCEDIAKSLKTVAHVSFLRRIKDGKFSIDDSISLDELRKKSDTIESVLVPLENVLDGIPVILLSHQNAKDLAFGKVITVKDIGNNGDIYMAKSDDGFLGIVEYIDETAIKLKRLLKPQQIEGKERCR
jgi:tRNA pseudouridine55 synthase